VNGKSAAGVVLLEKYLDYAENGAAVLGVEKPVNYSAHAEQNLEMEVRDYIRDLGFEVDMNYGLSAVKTDLAVRKPGSSDYMLCIEFDGESYHGLGNVRDRDRLRQEIMEKMGWKFTRVWATEWYKNAKKEKARLKKLLNA
jgi:very-short-patch-repair endonuclease